MITACAAVYWATCGQIVAYNSSWKIFLSMRQISLRERVEIAWFTRDIQKSHTKHGSQAFSVG